MNGANRKALERQQRRERFEARQRVATLDRIDGTRIGEERMIEARLTRQRQHARDPLALMSEVLFGKVIDASLSSESSYGIALGVRMELPSQKTHGSARNSAMRILTVLHQQTKVLAVHAPEVALVIANLAKRAEFWIREPEGWRCPTRNRHKALASLIRHLVARWPVPSFMDRAWETNEHPEHIDWYLLIGQGGNIRKAQGLPIVVTRKVAHAFLSVPADEVSSIGQALTWAWCQSEGASVRTMRAILATGRAELADTPEVNDFWLSVWRWVIAQPMLAPDQIGPIADYIHYHKYVKVPHRDGPDRPLQPGFSMARRDADSLVTKVHQWHRGLARRSAGKDLSWRPMDLKAKHELPEYEEAREPVDLPPTAGRGYWQSRRGGRKRCFLWTMVELLSWKELWQEGNTHKHCVVTYAPACQRGGTSIWSLRCEGEGSLRYALTVEVDVKKSLIVQARGKCNAPPDEGTRSVLESWAAASGLTIGRGV